MAIRVVVELLAKPGKRTELVRLMDRLVNEQGPQQKGFRGSERYGVPGNPDMLVEIADWDSAGDRETHMKEAAARGVYAPLADLLAAPFRATVIERL